jgi:hypothetical protein
VVCVVSSAAEGVGVSKGRGCWRLSNEANSGRGEVGTKAVLAKACLGLAGTDPLSSVSTVFPTSQPVDIQTASTTPAIPHQAPDYKTNLNACKFWFGSSCCYAHMAF